MSKTEEDDAVCMDHDAALDVGTAPVYKQPMTSIKPNDIVMWCKTRYIVVDVQGDDGIWGYRFDQPTNITPVLYLLGYPEDMEVVGKMLGTVE